MNRRILKNLLIVFSLLVFCETGSLFAQQGKYTSLVNPFIGTDGFGHTFPGATVPYGMVQLSPDTRTSGWDACSGYHSSHPTILGFSHTHLSGTGASDYGDIMFMATNGVQLMPGDESDPLTGYRSAYRHETEKAKPGYYRVMLDDYGIQAEMTATTRCGFQKYTFPASDNAVIILDLVHGIADKVTGAEIRIIDEKTISGFRRSRGWAKDHYVYFYAELSVPFREAGIADKDGKNLEGRSQAIDDGLKLWMKYKIRNYDSILIKVGISTVSEENARANLQKEIPGWDFIKTNSDASTEWESELSRIAVEGGKKSDRVNFYTALYHTMISPNIMSDSDGRYRGMDGKIHRMERGSMYTVFSLWDTFRAFHPLLTIIDPVRAQEMVRALLQKYRESGMLPVWELASNETNCMIGYHSVPVIVDAYMKGLLDFDIGLAYEAIKKSAMADTNGIDSYKKHRYIPANEENESVSKTLEYAYDDWCIAQMAREMKKEEDRTYFLNRSRSYLNLYDAQTGFMRGRKNANWVTPFDPFEVSGLYTEANAWQYTWFVPHDIIGMIEMMGGKQRFESRLDSLFSVRSDLKGRSQPDISGMMGQYAHGNEPSHHMAYLYNYTNKPSQTIKVTRDIMENFYTNSRDGLIGNEDCGQMSAWYIFSAMGFYPVCPGSDEYETGAPLFPKITIGKNAGNKFVITADTVSSAAVYVREIRVNGRTINFALNHKDLMQGGTMEFRMSEIPGNDTRKVDMPAVTGTVMMPYLVSGEQTFTDSCLVSMFTSTANAEIRYTTDGTEPNRISPKYVQPFYIRQTTQFRMKAFDSANHESPEEQANFIKLPYKKTVSYTFPYSHLYTAGGAFGLVDGIHGKPGVFGGWQGFYGDDFIAVIDLQKIRPVKKIEVTFLQEYPSWIWLPADVEMAVSSDGKKFENVYYLKNIIAADAPGSFIQPFTATFPEKKVRYVKVSARNIGTCPDWHPGSGEKAWIFVDEVEIE